MYCICSSCCLRGCLWEMYSFLLPPSLADYLGWHLSINCTYCYTFFCRSSTTRLCDEHILSIQQHFFFFHYMRIFFLQKWLECHSSSMTWLLSQTRDPDSFHCSPCYRKHFWGRLFLAALPSSGLWTAGLKKKNPTWPSGPHKGHKSPTIRQFLHSAVLYITFSPHGLSC